MPDAATIADLATLVTALVTAMLVLVTGGLVLATLAVAVASAWQVYLMRRSHDLAIRPLLADPHPDPTKPPDRILFGAPGRQSFDVSDGELWMKGDGTQISLPFRNVGAGVAVITGASTEPKVDGSVYVSRKFVPVGEHVRVNISRMGNPGSEVPIGDWWAMKPFAVLIEYTDASGGQALVTRADFEQYATQGPFVGTISISKKGSHKPFAVGRSSM